MNGDTIFLLVGAAAFVLAWIYTGGGGISIGGGESRLGKLLRQVDAAIEAEAWKANAADMAAGRKAELRRRLAESIDPKGDPPGS